MKVLLLIGVLCLSIYSIGQDQYKIITTGKLYTKTQIEEAFNNANLCGFVYENKINQIQFVDGTLVHILPYSQIQNVPKNCTISDQKEFQSAQWSISESGILLRKLTVKKVKQ